MIPKNLRPLAGVEMRALRHGVLAAAVAAVLTLVLGSAAWAQSTYTWSGGEGPAPWSDADNWSPSRITIANDDVMVINTSATITGIPLETIGQLLVADGATVSLQAGIAGTILTLDGGTGTDFDVAAGSTLNLNGTALQISLSPGATGTVGGSITATAGAQRILSGGAGALVFQSGSVMTCGTGFSGNVFGTTSLNSVVFQSGSLYVHVAGSNPFGAGQPNSVLTFEAGSRFRLDGNTSPAATGRTYADFEYNATGANAITGGAPLSIDNLFITQGTMNCNMTGLFSLRGNITVNGGAALNFSPTSPATVSLNGSTSQAITVNGSFNSTHNSTFSINNPNGVVLGSNLTIGTSTAGGGISFLNGRITTGANSLTIASGASISGAGSGTGWVAGNLIRNVPVGGTRTMDVGDAAVYAPVALQVNGLGSAFNLAASTMGAEHSSVGTSGLDATRSVNRTWTLTPQSAPTFADYSAVFGFAAADVDLGADPANFAVRRFNGASWSLTTTGVRTATSTQATGITAFSDFAVGEPQHTLAVTVVGTGAVAKVPDQAGYDEGTLVDLTATPGVGYQFAGWSGDASGTANPLTVTMDANKSITATFTIITYTLDVTVVGNGTVAKVPEQASYGVGELVELTATPAVGYEFVGWSGDASGTTNPLTVTMDANKSITATFAASRVVVVSQIYGGGGNSGAPYHNDYIELFNRGTTSVDLTGWSVQYTSAAGSSWATTPLSGSIAAGGYYLVQQAAGTGGGASLPTPDAVGAIAMNLASGKVALVASATALTGTCPSGGDLVDLVGYGAAGCSETAPTGILSNTTAAHRNSGGCVDTDHNANDFTVSGPAPRNSSAPTNSCVFTLAVTVAPPGGGTVAKVPDLASYPAETPVELTATRTSGYHFAGWTGDFSGTANPATVIMDGNKTIVANFELNSTVGLVVVSQVYGGGGNTGAQYQNDFIELFNRGNLTVDITGWSVQYASDSGSVWFTTNLIGSIPPGGFYLIRQGAGAGSGAVLPTADAIGTIGLSAVSGKVALVNNDAVLSGNCPSGPEVIDFVGYGRADCSEGAPASSLSNTMAAHRREDGCVDTGNNLGDFGTAVPTPRNSATPTSFCPIWTGTEDVIVSGIELGNVSPNPSRESMRIPFVLPRESDVRLSVHDLQGRLVTTLADGRFASGRHELIWDGRGVSGLARSGVYFIRMETAGEIFVRRASLTR